MTKIRTGQAPAQLSRIQFRERFAQSFKDPLFAPEAATLARVEDVLFDIDALDRDREVQEEVRNVARGGRSGARVARRPALGARRKPRIAPTQVSEMSGSARTQASDGPQSRSSGTSPGDAAVSGVEHWTHKGEVRLFLWEKFVGSPAAKPAVLFVHGSSMASQPTFDLSVPGRPDSSVMDWFARRGFACWSVDMEGYGRSDKSRDITCDIANGADDLTAATDYIASKRGQHGLLIYGISSGALRAALFAQQHPERGSRLALDAFV
jgi:acetyl esterase/lipase